MIRLEFHRRHNINDESKREEREEFEEREVMKYWTLVSSSLVMMSSLLCGLASGQVIERVFDGMTFVRIESGIFSFGSPSEQLGRLANESPIEINMNHVFWMGKYEVSQGEWIAIMGNNPSTYRRLGPELSAPVENMTWFQARAFIDQLNEQAGDQYYRLPTEAEWEYVSKGGANSAWAFGDDLLALEDYAHRGEVIIPQLRGLKASTSWGIYDLYGNVYEWTEDWYQAHRSPEIGACSPQQGTYKVIRGGSNGCETSWLRASSRNFASPNRSSYSIGLRLVRVDTPSEDPLRVGGICAVESGEEEVVGNSLPGLNIVEIDPNLPAYDRDDWPHWVDVDGDCLNTRHEVLAAESLIEVSTSAGNECLISGGSWDDPYTALTFSVAGELDVDHFVPLSNAHKSGGWAWTRDQRRAYANDLSDPHHLIAVQASANRSKGARGPEDWRPPNEAYHCDYAYYWIQIKARWGLSATPQEWLALLDMLDTCPQGRPPITDAPEVDETLFSEPDHPGDVVNCGDFDNYDQAYEWFIQYYDEYGDIANLDGDGDGIPCGSLPGAP